MNTQHIGLASNAFTWPLYVVLASCWLISVWACAPIGRLGWRGVITSLYGMVWAAFGIEVVFRFPVLSWDSVFFGNYTLRLADIPPEIINKTLLTLIVFWLCFSAIFRVLSARKIPSLLSRIVFLSDQLAYEWVVPSVCLCSACIYLSSKDLIPNSLITPVALAGSLWILPAVLIWTSYWKRQIQGAAQLHLAHVLVFVPGVISVVLNPYREMVLAVALVPFLAALFAGCKPKFKVVLFSTAVLLISSTVAIDAYRIVVWSPSGNEDLKLQQQRWREDPASGPWMDLLRRFHALDSLLMTEDLVPDVLPYTNEDLFASSLIRGLFPRILYSNKQADDRGLEFARTIWGFGDHYSDTAASIAPSMPGDLYRAGGMLYVAIGALIWGILLGIVESWKNRLHAAGQAALMVIFGLQAAGSVERDFGHVISTCLQILVVLVLVVCIVTVKAYRSAPTMVAYREPLSGYPS